ncbi:RNA-binding domain-containing protein, partial [Nadsonia fulvescens var. elongata DSM 6958]
RRLDSNRNNNDTTVYVGNLDDRVDERLLYELMLQAGPLVNVYLPKDRVNQQHQGYGFAEFVSEKDAIYAANIMNQIKLFGKPLKVNKASADKQKLIDVGADLFVGNLDQMVDEEFLYNTFSSFGQLFEKPRIARDRATNAPKGYAFIKYCDFESSDKAIESLNGQFLMNKEVTVDYALKSGENGKRERHGDTTERLLAQEAKKNN